MCIHPLCQKGAHSEEMSWYPGDPPLSFIPVPSPDPKRRFGNKHCEECYGLCSGHYLKVGELWEHVSSGGEVQAHPPRDVILREFNQRHAQRQQVNEDCH